MLQLLGFTLGGYLAFKYLTRSRTQSVALGRIPGVNWGGRLPSKYKLWQLVLEDSNVPYPADFVRADSQYRRWMNKYAKNRGPKPVYTGGETDAINEYLSLQGGKRVSGPFEGFYKMTANIRTWDQLNESDVFDVLNDVPGLERLRMPEGYMEYKLAKDEEEYFMEFGDTFEDELSPSQIEEISYSDEVPF